MYLRKAWLDHLPIIMIVKTGHSPKYMAIAAPDLIEWVPMSLALTPSMSSPIAMTDALRESTISSDVMCSMRPCLQMAESGVSALEPG